MLLAIPGPCELFVLLLLAAAVYGIVVTVKRRRVERHSQGFDVLPPDGTPDSNQPGPPDRS